VKQERDYRNPAPVDDHGVREKAGAWSRMSKTSNLWLSLAIMAAIIGLILTAAYVF
jgi:hypothetical protein